MTETIPSVEGHGEQYKVPAGIGGTVDFSDYSKIEQEVAAGLIRDGHDPATILEVLKYDHLV